MADLLLPLRRAFCNLFGMLESGLHPERSFYQPQKHKESASIPKLPGLLSLFPLCALRRIQGRLKCISAWRSKLKVILISARLTFNQLLSGHEVVIRQVRGIFGSLLQELPCDIAHASSKHGACSTMLGKEASTLGDLATRTIVSISS